MNAPRDSKEWSEQQNLIQSSSTAATLLLNESSSLKRPLPEEIEESEEEGDVSGEEPEHEDNDDDGESITDEKMAEILKGLQDDSLSTRYDSVDVTNDDNEGSPIKIRKGTLVRLYSKAKGEEEGWLTEVREIRGLKAEAKDYEVDGIKQKTTSGQQMLSSASVWLRTEWYFSADDLKALDRKYLYPVSVLKSLGAREMVKSNSRDWNSSEGILPNQEPDKLFFFDDSYPTFGTHPLVRPVTNQSELEPVEEGTRPLPYYFFGDKSKVLAVANLEPDKVNTWRGTQRDFSRSCYYRTSFENRDKKNKNKKPPTVIIKQKPLSLRTHSESKTPYNPAEIQHYSPLEEEWFHIKDLQIGSHWYDFLDARNEQFSSLSLNLEGDVDGKMNHLLGLAQSTIVRGCYYGLIGNSYIVTRARILLKEEQEDASDLSLDTAFRVSVRNTRREGLEALYEAWLEWRDQSDQRKALIMSSKNRRIIDPDAAGLPPGQAWVSPNLKAMHRI